MRLVTAAEMRAIDRAAIERCGVPGMALMERAGAAVARCAASLADGRRISIVCGAGNNGGDGWVAARLLHAAGHRVRVVGVTPHDRLQGDAARAALAAIEAGVSRVESEDPAALSAASGDVVVDALLGTGLSRAPEGAFAALIRRIEALRAAGARVLSVDIPSGLSADTGQPFTPCVRADRTVTFAYPKRGLVLHPGPAHAGEIEVVDIGIPPEAAATVAVSSQLLEEDPTRAMVPRRPPDAHKGSAGRVLVVAGSPGKSGAAHLALCGALRGGAGLVTLAARAAVLPLALASRPEAMSVALPGDGPLALRDLDPLLSAAEGVDALAIGPGIPRGPETAPLLRRLLETTRLPAVLDADALNAFAEAPALLVGLPTAPILTPHPGEMARLVGGAIGLVQADRIGVATEKAREWGCVVLLKGARTVIAAPGMPAAVVPTGNPGMATGGTGDVLAGLSAALLAGGLPAFDAACVAAFVHGLAGDLAAARHGERGLLAGDLADEIGSVWARWGR